MDNRREGEKGRQADREWSAGLNGGEIKRERERVYHGKKYWRAHPTVSTAFALCPSTFVSKSCPWKKKSQARCSESDCCVFLILITALVPVLASFAENASSATGRADCVGGVGPTVQIDAIRRPVGIP